MELHEKFSEEELKEKIEIILENFNFEKVHEHMVSVDWLWATNTGTMEIPSVESLKKTARILLTSAMYNETLVADCGTGGFTAYKLPWGMHLCFNIAHRTA